jgi:hypothetical protein
MAHEVDEHDGVSRGSGTDDRSATIDQRRGAGDDGDLAFESIAHGESPEKSWGRIDGCSLGLRGDLQKAATGGTAILDFRTIGHNGWGAKAPEATRE